MSAAVKIIAGALFVVIAASIYKAQDLRAAVAQIGAGWANLHPEVKRRALDVIDEANREFADEGLKVGLYSGWRTPEEQGGHIASGASFVDDALDSYHVWGLAADFVFIDGLGRWSWLPDPSNTKNIRFVDERWYKLGAIIEKHGFEWGGRWRNFDGPHGQFPLKRISELRHEYGEPKNFIKGLA